MMLCDQEGNFGLAESSGNLSPGLWLGQRSVESYSHKARVS